jgi:hypothetical protein
VGYPFLESEVQHRIVRPARAPPTLYQAMAKAGAINRQAFSIYLDDQQSGKGSIIFGGVDSTKYTGELVALPVLPNGTNYLRYSVALTGIVFNDDKGAHPLTDSNFAVPAVLDSGTAAQQIPASVTDAIFRGLGAVGVGVGVGVGDLTVQIIPCDYAKSNASVTYQFGGPGGPSINVPLAALIMPVGEQFENGQDICFIAMTPESGNGVILGDSFMRSGYFVYDVQNNQIAIAQANLDQTTTSALTAIPTGTSIPGCSSTNTLIISGGEVPPTAPPLSTVASATGVLNPGTPTFDLGSATASSIAGPALRPAAGIVVGIVAAVMFLQG